MNAFSEHETKIEPERAHATERESERGFGREVERECERASEPERVRNLALEPEPEREAEAAAARDPERVRTGSARTSAPAQAPVQVFFTIDDSYAPWLGVAAHSLIENAVQDRPYVVNVLYETLSDAHRAQLARLADGHPNIEVRFVGMRDRIDGIESDQDRNKLRADYFTLSIFYRLFIPELFPDIDRAVYLDADIVVEADIAELFDTDLDGNLIGACSDRSVWGAPDLVAFIEQGQGIPLDTYINSGMLLMDMDALRRAGLARRFLDVLGAYNLRTLAPDQDYLNALCHGRILYLPEEWDAMPVVGTSELPDPKIVHYNLFAKPWCYDGVPYGDRFWNYAATSGFEKEARAYKAGYSPERKKRDEESQRRLLANGRSIAGDAENFASVFGGGKEARL